MESPVKLLRQVDGMRRAEFAWTLGLTRGVIRRLEFGLVQMSAFAKAAFAAYGVDANQLESEHEAFRQDMLHILYPRLFGYY